MHSANINQAMINRANTQYEIKNVNNRIDGVINRVNGVDVVFRQNEEITSAVLSSILSGTGFNWLSGVIESPVYEAPAPSSYINNLRPASMWKCHVVNDDNSKFMADAYSPLESFVRYDDDSIMFSLLQPGDVSSAPKNYGGNLPIAIMELLTASDAVRTDILLSNILSSNTLNTNNLYYIQNTNHLADQLGGTAESFTLHFE